MSKSAIWRMDLNARALVDFGLAPAARQYVDRLCASTGLSIKLHITGQVRRLPAEVERLAFRGLQEALTNTLRHAQATEIAAQLHLGPRALRLTVQDNGRGLRSNAAAARHGAGPAVPAAAGRKPRRRIPHRKLAGQRRHPRAARAPPHRARYVPCGARPSWSSTITKWCARDCASCWPSRPILCAWPKRPMGIRRSARPNSMSRSWSSWM